MVSVIAQERLLGAALGGVMAAAITFEERKCIYRSVSTNQKHVATQSQEITGTLSTRNPCSRLASLWNATIDGSLGPVIRFLSSRGW
ncbi:uncharacterized protein LOC116253579 [Nymphaea colorata]|nr:uncharacterized protein LOC116253579 [Nymphaea colorata]